MDSVSAHQKGMPMASHHQNQLVARCIVALADSERFADNHLVAAACSAVALAFAAGSGPCPGLGRAADLCVGIGRAGARFE